MNLTAETNSTYHLKLKLSQLLILFPIYPIIVQINPILFSFILYMTIIVTTSVMSGFIHTCTTTFVQKGLLLSNVIFRFFVTAWRFPPPPECAVFIHFPYENSSPWSFLDNYGLSFLNILLIQPVIHSLVPTHFTWHISILQLLSFFNMSNNGAVLKSFHTVILYWHWLTSSPFITL